MNKKEIKEALAYLGNGGRAVNRSLLDEIERAREELEKSLHFFHIVKKYPLIRLEEGIRLGETKILLTGKDVKRYLGFSKEVYVVCASLGNEVSSVIEKEMEERIGKALVIDATASAMVTSYMTELEEEIEKIEQKRGFFLTKRFGAGYGDLPLGVQREIFEELELSKKGFSIDERDILSPEKTLISLIGVLEQREEERKGVCEICKFKEVCRMKKQGAKCVCFGKEELKEEIVIKPIERKESSYQDLFLAYQKGEILIAELLLFLEKGKASGEKEEKKEDIILVSVSKGKDFGKKILKAILEMEGFSVSEKEEVSSKAEIIILSANYFSKKEEVERKISFLEKEIPQKKRILIGGMFSEKEMEDFKAIRMRNIEELVRFMRKGYKIAVEK